MVVEIRDVRAEDAELLCEWLSDPETSRCFPVADAQEIEEASKRWVEFALPSAGLIAEYKGAAVGFAMLFLHNYRRLAHQSYCVLVVDRPYRNLGVGSALLEALMAMARERHSVELLHTEVYDDPEVLRFFKRRDFTECARQEDWARDGDDVRARVVIERFI